MKEEAPRNYPAQKTNLERRRIQRLNSTTKTTSNTRKNRSQSPNAKSTQRLTKQQHRFSLQIRKLGFPVCLVQHADLPQKMKVLVYRYNYSGVDSIPLSETGKYFPCSWHYHQDKLQAFEFSDKEEKFNQILVQEQAKKLLKLDPQHRYGVTIRPVNNQIQLESKHLSLMVNQKKKQTIMDLFQLCLPISVLFLWKPIFLFQLMPLTLFIAYCLNSSQEPQSSQEPTQFILSSLHKHKQTIKNSYAQIAISKDSVCILPVEMQQINTITPKLKVRDLEFQLKQPKKARKAIDKDIIQNPEPITCAELVLQDITAFNRNIEALITPLSQQIKQSKQMVQLKKNVAKNIKIIHENAIVTSQPSKKSDQWIIKTSNIDVKKTNQDIEVLCKKLGLGSATLRPCKSLRGGGPVLPSSYSLAVEADPSKVLQQMQRYIKQKNQMLKQFEKAEVLDEFYSRYRATHSSMQQKYAYIKNKKFLIELAIVMDTTSSMDSCLNTAKKECANLIDKCTSKQPDRIKFKLAFVSYSDYDEDPFVKAIDFKDNKEEIKHEIESIQCIGGADMAEAMIEGLEATAKLSWSGKHQSKKYVFIVCDAPPHGQRFGNDLYTDDHLEQNQGDLPVAQLFRQKNIKLSIIKVRDELLNTIPQFQKIFGDLYFHSNSSYPQKIVEAIHQELNPKIQELFRIGKRLDQLFDKSKLKIQERLVKKIELHIQRQKQQEAVKMSDAQSQQVEDKLEELTSKWVEQIGSIKRGEAADNVESMSKLAMQFLEELQNLKIKE